MNKRQRKKHGIVPPLTWQRKRMNNNGAGEVVSTIENLFSRLKNLGVSSDVADSFIDFHTGHDLDFYHYYPSDTNFKEKACETFYGLMNLPDDQLMKRMSDFGCVTFTCSKGKWTTRIIENGVTV